MIVLLQHVRRPQEGDIIQLVLLNTFQDYARLCHICFICKITYEQVVYCNGGACIKDQHLQQWRLL